MLKEKSLEMHKDYLEKKIADRKDEKSRATTTICELQNEIQTVEVEIDFLKNYVKHSQVEESKAQIETVSNNAYKFNRKKSVITVLHRQQTELSVINLFN